MKMHVGTGWIDKPETIEVINPYDRSVVDTVPKSDLKDVDTAIATAVRGSQRMAQMTSYERYRLLHRAAELMEARMEEFAHTITPRGRKDSGRSQN
ncbi:MAG: aldehyde dehydrogenase family protein [bacterium]|nr:aldehyde dehydrogenase family protein [bacterium]